MNKVYKKYFTLKIAARTCLGFFIALNFINICAYSDAENNNIYLFRAAKRGDINWVKKLVEKKGANPNYVTSSGKTVLIKAVTKNRDKVTAYLLGLKDKNEIKLVKVDYLDNNGQTALHKAAKNNNLEITKMLLGAGAIKDKQDRWGNSPIHIAIKQGYFDIVKELVLQGADLNIKNNDGDTPLHLASKNNYKSIAELIISGGKIDIRAKNVNGKTPLQCSKGKPKMIRFLENVQ